MCDLIDSVSIFKLFCVIEEQHSVLLKLTLMEAGTEHNDLWGLSKY